MVLRIIRWLRGYIVFSISGAFPERFLNAMNRRGIRHWDFIPRKGGYEGKMFLSEYMKIRPVARDSSVRLRSEKRIGLPFFIKKYKKRKGLFFGAAAAVLILVIMSRFVWDINVVGAEGLSLTELYSAFDDCGFRVGMLKSQLDVEAVERQIQLKVPEVRWVSVNAINNIATVEIKQLAKAPRMKVKKYPCNIAAAEDGVITDIEVGRGTCEVKRGWAVARNRLLVNSVVEIGEGKQKYVHSMARIMADVRKNKTINIPIKKNSIILKSNYTQKSVICFLFFSVPFELSPSLSGTEVFNTFKEQPVINEVTLPVSRTVRRSYYFEDEIQTLTADKAEKILRARMALYECFCENMSTVKQRKLSLSRDNGGFVLNVDYILNKNIAKKQKLKIE